MKLVKKKDDTELTDIASLLCENGWKKLTWLYYKYMDDKNLYIVDANIGRNTDSKQIEAILQLSSIELNQISHFMWEYGRTTSGAYTPPKLSAGKNVNDFRRCYLYKTQRQIELSAKDAAKSATLIDDAAAEIFDTYGSIDALLDLYKGDGGFIGPLLCLYMLKGELRKAKDLLVNDGFGDESGAGDVRYGAWHHLKTNVA